MNEPENWSRLICERYSRLSLTLCPLWFKLLTPGLVGVLVYEVLVEGSAKKAITTEDTETTEGSSEIQNVKN